MGAVCGGGTSNKTISLDRFGSQPYGQRHNLTAQISYNSVDKVDKDSFENSLKTQEKQYARLTLHDEKNQTVRLTGDDQDSEHVTIGCATLRHRDQPADQIFELRENTTIPVTLIQQQRGHQNEISLTREDTIPGEHENLCTETLALTPEDEKNSSDVLLADGDKTYSEEENTEQVITPAQLESNVNDTRHTTELITSIGIDTDFDTKITHNSSFQEGVDFNSENTHTIQGTVMADELSDVKQGFDECVSCLKENRHRQSFKQLSEMFREKMETSSVYKYQKPEQRRLMGDYLNDINYAKIATDYYKFILKDIGAVAVTEVLLFERHENPGIMLLLQIRTSLMNYSDASYNLGEAIANTDIFEYIVEDLKKIFSQGLEDLEARDEAFHSAVGILNNCGKSPLVFKRRFQDFHVTEHLRPFFDSEHDLIKVVTLLGLANIVSHDNDDENKLLAGEKRVFDYYMAMIKKTGTNAMHTEGGFTLEELVGGLAKMAKNDKNRQMIMEEYASSLLPQLKEMMKDGSDEEKESAVKAIWELGFEEKCKRQLKKDDDLLKCLQSLRHNSCESLSEAARNACFVLVGKDWQKETGTGEPGHIMISYSWVNQPILKKVYRRLLEEGHSVWMDIDRMEGSLLESMAEAVEQASVVLICYSEKYKESRNCRVEAEYAHSLAKPILPLRMQKDYDPRGWLGAIIAGQMYYEFTSKYKFSKMMEQVLSKTEKYKIGNANTVKKEDKAADKKKYGVVREWAVSDLQNWLQDNCLSQYSQLQRLTGEHVDFLHELSEMAPEFYFRCLEVKLGLNSLDELMTFNRAIKKL